MKTRGKFTIFARFIYETKQILPMKISDKKVVELIYELRVGGEVVDKTTRERPLDFIQGMGYLLPLFESNIAGKEPGDSFAFTLSPEDGYGTWEKDRVIELPKEAFEVDGQIREDLLVEGNVIPLMNSMGGVVPGKVLAVGEKTVRMDLNHPMAGKTLDFSGEIVSVRDATEKEISEGLHGEFVQQHQCSCGCGHDGCEGHEGGCCHEGHEGHEGGCCHEGHEGHEGGCCHEGHEGGCCHHE